MAGDLNFKVGFETEQAASAFRQLFQEYVNGSQKAGDEANKLLGGTIKKNVEVRLEVDKQSGAKQLTTVINRARTELDQYERQFRKSTAVDPGSLTNIRQALRQAKQARDSIRQFAEYAADASGKMAFKGPETGRFIEAQQRVKDLENQMRALQAASGNAFDRIKVGFNLDNLFKAGQQLNDIVSVFQSLQIAISAIISPITAVSRALGELQSFALSFKAIGAGAAGAGIALSESSRIALGLGVNIKTVREGMQQLSPVILNAGGGLGDVSAIMESLSSRFAAFGLNADKSRRVMNGIIQAFSKGKLMAEELTQQISEADPAFKSDLAKAIGVSTAELEKMVKAGKVTSDVLIKTLPSLSKAGLLFGKLGDSATSAVDAFDKGNVILSQVENNIASISQLNLEALSNIAQPIVSSFLRAQATVVDFVSRISKLEATKAVVGILAAIAREAVRVADVFLRVAEGFLIVLTPIAKLVNLLLEIPGASSLVGLAIIGNLIKPLQGLGKTLNQNIIQQSAFAQQVKTIWADIGRPFTLIIDKIKEVNRGIASSISGKRVDLFKGGQKGAVETSAAIRGISQSTKEVTSEVQENFKKAFNSAKAEVDGIKNELNQLRKSAITGSFVPVGPGAQRSLKDLRLEADALRGSLGQIGPSAREGISQVSKFQKELNDFGRVSNPVNFQKFKESIASIRVTDPVRALGLLQEALRQVRSEFKDLPEGSYRQFVRTKEIKQLKTSITELADDFRQAGQKIPRSTNEIGNSIAQIGNSFDKVNADRLLVVQGQIAEAESQIAGSALRLNDSLTQAQSRLDGSSLAMQRFGGSVKTEAVPALQAFSRESKLLADKKDIENRLSSIREEFSRTVTAINRDARTVAKAKLPGTALSGSNAEAALAAVAARGNAEQVNREENLRKAIERRNAATAKLAPTLQAVNNELLNLKLNNDAAALFPKSLADIGVSASGSARGLSILNAAAGTLSGVSRLGSLAIGGLRAAFVGLAGILGPIGIALIAIQVATAAWANATKGTTKGLKEGQVAVDAYKAALEDLENVTLDRQGEEVSALQKLWNNFSLFLTDLLKNLGSKFVKFAEDVQSYKPPKWIEDLTKFFESTAFFNDDILNLDASDGNFQLRQYTDSLDAVLQKSKEATSSSKQLAAAIQALGAAAQTDEVAKQKQINAYIQMKNAIQGQQKDLITYKQELSQLNAIEATGGKLTDEQVAKRKKLSETVAGLTKEIDAQENALISLALGYSYLETAAKANENSFNSLSEKLKEVQEKLNGLTPGTPEWVEAATEVVIFETKLDKLKKALGDPLYKKELLNLQINKTSKELDQAWLEVNRLREALAGGLLNPAETEIAKTKIAELEKKIDDLGMKLTSLKSTNIVIDAEVKFKVNKEGFDAQIADLRSKLAATEFTSKINGALSPELKSAAQTVASSFSSVTEMTRKVADARRAYANAVSQGDLLGQVQAAQQIALAGENYKIAVAEARAAMQDSVNSLRQGLVDGINELRNLKLNNLDLLPPAEQVEAIRQLNREVQRIAERRGLKVTFTGTPEQILQAKQRFVDFYTSLEKGEDKIKDIKSAIQTLESSIVKLGSLKLGADGELFKTSIEKAGGAAAIAVPYINEIQKSLSTGKIAAEGISAALLNLDGKTITVKVVTTGTPGRWAGGPVSAGTTYRVNELGREGFLSNSGRLTDINRPRNATWRPPTSGTVIPAHVMRSIDVPKTGISVAGSRVGRIASSMHSAGGSNALIRELRRIAVDSHSAGLGNEIATTHAAQTMEIGRLTRAVRELVEKDWNVNVKVRNNGGTTYMNALNRLS